MEQGADSAMCNAGPPHCIPSILILGMRNKVSMEKRKEEENPKTKGEGRRDYIERGDGLCAGRSNLVKGK